MFGVPIGEESFLLHDLPKGQVGDNGVNFSDAKIDFSEKAGYGLGARIWCPNPALGKSSQLVSYCGKRSENTKKLNEKIIIIEQE